MELRVSCASTMTRPTHTTRCAVRLCVQAFERLIFVTRLLLWTCNGRWPPFWMDE